MGDTLVYYAERILWQQGKGVRRRYLVLWKAYPSHEATWELESHLADALHILEEYLRSIAMWIKRGPRLSDVVRLGMMTLEFDS